MKLNENEKFKIIRPSENDQVFIHDIPIIKKDDFNLDILQTLNLYSYKNISLIKDKTNTLLHFFVTDNELEKIWNNPLKNILKYRDFFGVSTLDFTISANMDLEMIRNNIYRSRKMGCKWQNFGIKVIPTIQWADERSYKFSFESVEKGSLVMISTLGCLRSKDMFLKGYFKMMKIIEPKVVIVYGDYINGMYGDLVLFDYEDAFIKKKEKINPLFEYSKLIHLEKGSNYGK